MYFAFSALKVLVGRREEHLACKNWMVGCWCGYLSGARCRMQIVCIWSSWCHCLPKTLSSLASFKSRLVLPFWHQLTQVVLEKRPLNGCSKLVHWVGHWTNDVKLADLIPASELSVTQWSCLLHTHACMFYSPSSINLYQPRVALLSNWQDNCRLGRL